MANPTTLARSCRCKLNQRQISFEPSNCLSHIQTWVHATKERVANFRPRGYHHLERTFVTTLCPNPVAHNPPWEPEISNSLHVYFQLICLAAALGPPVGSQQCCAVHRCPVLKALSASSVHSNSDTVLELTAALAARGGRAGRVWQVMRRPRQPRRKSHQWVLRVWSGLWYWNAAKRLAPCASCLVWNIWKLSVLFHVLQSGERCCRHCNLLCTQTFLVPPQFSENDKRHKYVATALGLGACPLDGATKCILTL
jgi:hypothetical protein